jgi:hypothetical protein
MGSTLTLQRQWSGAMRNPKPGTTMTKIDHIEELMTAWDEMDNAAQRVAISLPDKLSESVARMETARLRTRDVMQRVTMLLSRS